MTTVELIPAAPKPLEVINSQMIHDSIIAERKEKALRETEKTDIPTEYSEEVILEEETEVKLSFNNIYKIENLVGLPKLTKLCLDNNVIEKISGLDQFKNLTWLGKFSVQNIDLSFNNITDISGLDQLVNLTDLSLFSNRITKIENLFHLKELIFLSLGNNNIQELIQVQSLRKLPKLRAITLSGNPISQDQGIKIPTNKKDYRTVCLAYLKHLRYLDYTLLDEKEIIEAREIKQDELLNVNEVEAVQEIENQKKEEKEKEMEELREAYVDLSVTIITDLLNSDQELSRIRILPEINEIIDNLTAQSLVVGEVLKEEGLQISQLMKKEYAMYYKISSEYKSTVEAESIEIVNSYIKRKKRILHQLSYSIDSQTTRELSDLIASLDVVKKDLLGKEIFLIDSMKKFNDKFETRYYGITGTFKEKLTTFFRAIEELVKQFSKDLNIKIIDLCELMNNEAPGTENWNEDIRNILIDKDNLMTTLTQINESLIGKLLAKDDGLNDKIKLESKSLIEKTVNEEIKRNQNRVTEIATFIKKELEELNSLLNSEEEGGSDYD